MGILRSKHDTCAISLDMDTIFLHPNQAPLNQPAEDPFLRGTVTLSLVAPRKVSTIKVALKGTTNINGGRDLPYQTYDGLYKTLEIDLKGERLGKGDHSYHFSFIIPSTTATSERSKFGTVRYSVRASVEGLGSFGTPVHSPYMPVWLISNPAGLGDVPQGVELIVQDAADDIGPIVFNVSSPHLTVASLLFVNISLLAPPAMKIMSVAAYIQQEFTIVYADPLYGAVKPPSQKKILFYVDSTVKEPDSSCSSPDPSSSTESLSLIDRGLVGRGASPPVTFEPRRYNPKPFMELEGGSEWSYSRIVRVPDDDHVRPTTLERTDTRIKVSHRIVAELKYRVGASKRDMLLTASTEITIASCCCVNDSLLLPSYARAAPPNTPIRPFHRRCLCNQSLRQMVEKHGAELERAERRPQHQRRAAAAAGREPEPPKLGMPRGSTLVPRSAGEGLSEGSVSSGGATRGPMSNVVSTFGRLSREMVPGRAMTVAV